MKLSGTAPTCAEMKKEGKKSKQPPDAADTALPPSWAGMMVRGAHSRLTPATCGLSQRRVAAPMNWTPATKEMSLGKRVQRTAVIISFVFWQPSRRLTPRGQPRFPTAFLPGP